MEYLFYQIRIYSKKLYRIIELIKNNFNHFYFYSEIHYQIKDRFYKVFNRESSIYQIKNNDTFLY